MWRTLNQSSNRTFYLKKPSLKQLSQFRYFEIFQTIFKGPNRDKTSFKWREEVRFQWAKVKYLHNRHILIAETFLSTAGVTTGKFYYTYKYTNDQNFKKIRHDNQRLDLRTVNVRFCSLLFMFHEGTFQ